MQYKAYDPYFTLEYVDVELEAPKFSTGQTVYSAYTGKKIVLTNVKPGFTLLTAPNGANMLSAATWLCHYRNSDGGAQWISESGLVATKEEVKGIQPRYPRCPICGGVVTEANSFIDGSGLLRHEEC